MVVLVIASFIRPRQVVVQIINFIPIWRTIGQSRSSDRSGQWRVAERRGEWQMLHVYQDRLYRALDEDRAVYELFMVVSCMSIRACIRMRCIRGHLYATVWL